MTNLQQEEALVERARRDPEAFGELYDRYYGRIFGYVLKRTANIDVAQDVTSEVFFKALKNLERFRWRGVPFSAWLYRIAGNEIANVFRRGKREWLYITETSQSDLLSNTSLEAEAAQAEEQLLRHEEFLALHESISRLPPKYQEVITLRYFEDKQLKEIAAILGKSEGTVKSLLHRGLRKLRILME